jgi:kinesin family protein C2/C3
VACLLRKVSQEIERRISTQAEHIRTVCPLYNYNKLLFTSGFLSRFPHATFLHFIQQSNLFKAREEKYQSRIRVLEALVSETREENEVYKKIIV